MRPSPAPELLERFEREDQAEEVSLTAEREIRQRGKMSLGMWLEHSRWPVWLISIMGFSYIVFWSLTGRGFALNLNILTLALFTLALSLHDTPMHFLMSMERSAWRLMESSSNFPFSVGTQGMLGFIRTGRVLLQLGRLGGHRSHFSHSSLYPCGYPESFCSCFRKCLGNPGSSGSEGG